MIEFREGTPLLILLISKKALCFKFPPAKYNAYFDYLEQDAICFDHPSPAGQCGRPGCAETAFGMFGGFFEEVAHGLSGASEDSKGH
ncbi:conserved domain protein [delta proteobacterium NaphS2]|nr:conserved domain protein [delta proteobacterium NaphS2]